MCPRGGSLVFATAEATAVTGGVPFAAGNASTHRVQIGDGPTVAASCAVDALGIPAILGRDAEVHSTDPRSGEPVLATSRRGSWRWQPESSVVFIGSSGSGRLTESCCPVITFFTDADNARAYQRQHHLDGDVLTMPEAAGAGALVLRRSPLAERDGLTRAPANQAGDPDGGLPVWVRPRSRGELGTNGHVRLRWCAGKGVPA